MLYGSSQLGNAENYAAIFLVDSIDFFLYHPSRISRVRIELLIRSIRRVECIFDRIAF